MTIDSDIVVVIQRDCFDLTDNSKAIATIPSKKLLSELIKLKQQWVLCGGWRTSMMKKIAQQFQFSSKSSRLIQIQIQIQWRTL